MDKKKAVEMFGGVVAISKAIGVAPQAVSKWPDPLPARISDRVIAACVRSGIDPAPLLDMPDSEAA